VGVAGGFGPYSCPAFFLFGLLGLFECGDAVRGEGRCGGSVVVFPVGSSRASLPILLLLSA